MSQYFPKPYEAFGGDINVKVDLSNYATKADIKNISHFDTSRFVLKTNLADLKTEVDKLDIDKLKSVPVELSKLSDVAKTDVVKKTDYNSKISEIENKIPDISNLAIKTALNAVKNKIPDTSGLVKKTDYTAKISYIESKISDISNLASTTALSNVESKVPNINGLATKTELTTVENKIPDISNLVTKTELTNLSNTVPDISTLIKKSDSDTKIREIENKCYWCCIWLKIGTSKCYYKRNFDEKINEVEKHIKKLQTFDWGYFIGKSYFGENGTQSYLIFQPIFRYFKISTINNNTTYVLSWKSKGLSDETIKLTTTSDNSLTPTLSYYYPSKIRVKVAGSCLKQEKVAFHHGKVVNI